VGGGEGFIITLPETSIVDNAFSAPLASGFCGGLLFLIVTPAVDLKLGLPAAAGHNTAILNGSLTETTSRAVRGVLQLPEIGRCKKVVPSKEGTKLVFHGLYRDAGCVKETEAEIETEPPNGKFEFTAGLAKPKFTGTLGALTLESGGGAKVTCTAGSEQGEYTGNTSETASLALTGCMSGTNSCQTNAAKAGEITSAALSGGLEYINETVALKPILGFDLKASGAFATFECGGKPVSVGGSVIAPVTPVDKMAAEMKLKFKATKGSQSPEMFEGGVKDTLTSNLSGSTEQAGLTTTVVIHNEEPVDIKGAVELQ
jgi:hypothetical protein